MTMISGKQRKYTGPKQGTIVGGLLLSLAIFLLLASFEDTTSSKFDYSLSLRKLSSLTGNNGEEGNNSGSKEIDSVEQLTSFYNLLFNSNQASVNDKFLDLQKQVRKRRECEAFPEVDKQPEDFDTDHQDSHITTISCVPVHYRIPTSSVQGVENRMVFGVLSELDNGKAKRDSIRKTWAQENTVFFVVAGDWNLVSDEYEEYRDILWIDQPEEYRDEEVITRKGARTFKSEIFLFAMYDQVLQLNPNVEYFFKTDDLVYVDVLHLQELIQEENEKKTVDYWGQCHNNIVPFRWEKHKWYVSYKDYPYTYFPSYCIGTGYVFSAKFLECTVGEGHIEKVPYLPLEDGAVGLLAEKCDIHPSMNWLPIQMTIPDDMDLMKKIPLYNEVITEDVMTSLHENFLRKWSD